MPMKKQTLQPGVWTLVENREGSFQVVGDRGIRVTQGVLKAGQFPTGSMLSFDPPAADAPYFIIENFRPKITNFQEMFGLNIWRPALTAYMMPDGSEPVDIVWSI